MKYKPSLLLNDPKTVAICSECKRECALNEVTKLNKYGGWYEYTDCCGSEEWEEYKRVDECDILPNNVAGDYITSYYDIEDEI